MSEVNTSSNNERWGLNGTTIKYIAAALMVFDHLHQFFQLQGAPIWFNMLGRPVLPMFLYMVAEGFYYTHSRKNYMWRLLLGFWLMGILNIVLSLVLPLSNLPDEQAPALVNNVFSTMFMTVFYLWAITVLKDGVREKKGKSILGGILLLLAPVITTVVAVIIMTQNFGRAAAVILTFIPNVLTVEGSFLMVLLGILFYLLRRWRWAQMLVLAALSLLTYCSAPGGEYNIQWMMVFAVIPLLFYNGKRGRGGKFDQYFFYLFYPAHIYIFYCIAWLLQR